MVFPSSVPNDASVRASGGCELSNWVLLGRAYAEPRCSTVCPQRTSPVLRLLAALLAVQCLYILDLLLCPRRSDLCVSVLLVRFQVSLDVLLELLPNHASLLRGLRSRRQVLS